MIGQRPWDVFAFRHNSRRSLDQCIVPIRELLGVFVLDQFSEEVSIIVQYHFGTRWLCLLLDTILKEVLIIVQCHFYKHWVSLLLDTFS